MPRELAIRARTPDSIDFDYNRVPAIEKDMMHRTLLDAIQRYFENPRVQAAFEEWQKKRSQNESA